MPVVERIKKIFSSMSMVTKPSDKVAATTTITNNLVGYLMGLSDFDNMNEDEIYEQLYIWEPEIGGAVDRISTMVGESFKYFHIKNPGTSNPEAVQNAVDGPPDGVALGTIDTPATSTPTGTPTSAESELEAQMVIDANKLYDSINIRQFAEVFSEILEIHGNLYLEPGKDFTLNILPNKYVTIIDRRDRIGGGQKNQNDFITQEKMLVLYEGQTDSERIIPEGKFIHVKYKSTPVFISDNKGRTTYGVYSPSPLHRVIIPLWWKRQTMITDILWRLRNVPREHHAISAEMFALDNYVGDLPTKRAAASADAKAFLAEYVKGINTLMPDQGYATLDTVDISMIENRGSNYMQTNELITQINEQVWSALNLPKSMSTGESHSSYASELVISNYTSQKVIQMAERIKPIILQNVRQRLLAINPNYPVDLLDIKVELNIATTELETYRKIALMVQTGLFTKNEIREVGGYGPLRKDQEADLATQPVNNSATSIPTNGVNTEGRYPQTPQSDVQHSRDSSESSYRSI